MREDIGVYSIYGMGLGTIMENRVNSIFLKVSSRVGESQVGILWELSRPWPIILDCLQSFHLAYQNTLCSVIRHSSHSTPLWCEELHNLQMVLWRGFCWVSPHQRNAAPNFLMLEAMCSAIYREELAPIRFCARKNYRQFFLYGNFLSSWKEIFAPKEQSNSISDKMENWARFFNVWKIGLRALDPGNLKLVWERVQIYTQK